MVVVVVVFVVVVVVLLLLLFVSMDCGSHRVVRAALSSVASTFLPADAAKVRTCASKGCNERISSSPVATRAMASSYDNNDQRWRRRAWFGAGAE